MIPNGQVKENLWHPMTMPCVIQEVIKQQNDMEILLTKYISNSRKLDSFNAHKHVKKIIGQRRSIVNILTDEAAYLILDTNNKRKQ